MKTVATLFIVLLTVSCNSSKNAGSAKQDSNTMPTLSGSYSIVSMNAKSMAGNSMELIFNDSDNSIAGSSGCNKLFGKFNQQESQLSFEGFGATKMYCDGKMALEQEFFQGLSVVNAVAIEDDLILLKNGDAVLMTLKRI